MDMGCFNTNQRAIQPLIVTTESASRVVSSEHDISEAWIAVLRTVDKIQTQLVGENPLNTLGETIHQDLLGQLVDYFRMS